MSKEGEVICVLLYISEGKCYDYDGMGRLVCVCGKGMNRLTVFCWIRRKLGRRQFFALMVSYKSQ